MSYFPIRGMLIIPFLLETMLSLCLYAQDNEPLEPPPEDPKFPIRRQATPEEVIRIYQKRLDQAPKDLSTRTKLGLAYLRLARETGNETHYHTAEAELQKVLDANPKMTTARAYMASAYMAQHKFREALELSQAVFKEDSRYTFALATIGDAHLELGQYDEAESAYRKLEKSVPQPLPEILARLGRIAEFRGKTDEAVRLLQEALQKETYENPNSSDQAWYYSRLAELYFNSNQIDLASEHYEAALKLKENSVPMLLGLGQVRAAQKRYAEAATLYEKAVAQKPDFDLIGDMATLYGLAGETEKAKELEAKARSLIPEAKKIETEARHLALFLADREIELELALESARKELLVREDVHAYDVLAWALLKNGQKEAAWEASQKALRLGTKDARMHYHAGMIARALGRKDEAVKHLALALEINPHFGFTEEAEVKKILAELKSE